MSAQTTRGASPAWTRALPPGPDTSIVQADARAQSQQPHGPPYPGDADTTLYVRSCRPKAAAICGGRTPRAVLSD